MLKKTLVVGYALLVFVAAAWLIVAIASTAKNTEPRPLSDGARQAVELYVERLSNLANMSIGLAGLVWVFLLKEDYKIRVAGRFGYTVFALINVSLFVSYVCYWCNYELIVSDLYSNASTVDLFANRVVLYVSGQYTFLVLGLVGLALLIFPLKPTGEQEA